jgi:hypothetical protein
MYEYFRLQKPILAMTPTDGETGRILSEVGGSKIVDISDESAIRKAIIDTCREVRRNGFPPPAKEKYRKYDRRELTKKLAERLDGILAG